MHLPDLPPRTRPARPDDVPDLLRMVRDLATYERSADRVRMTEERLAVHLFGDDPVAEAVVAEAAPGRPAGLAVWYRTFSTWDGEPGMHLEDLFVEEEHRGSGLGRDLLVALARVVVHRGWTRLQWDVLRWNTPSIRFYESLHASPGDEWLAYRLEGEPLADLAEG